MAAMADGKRTVAIGARADCLAPLAGTSVSRSAPSLSPSSLSEPVGGEGSSLAVGWRADPWPVELGRALVAIVLLLGVVRQKLALRRGGKRHLWDCRVGQAVDGYHAPVGAPCSKACVEAGAAYLLGLDVLGRDQLGATEAMRDG